MQTQRAFLDAIEGHKTRHNVNLSDIESERIAVIPPDQRRTQEEIAFRQIVFDSQLRLQSTGAATANLSSDKTSPRNIQTQDVSKAPPRARPQHNSDSANHIRKTDEVITSLSDYTFQDFGNIVFENCTFQCDLDLTGVRCRTLSLRNCRIRTVLANDIQIDGTADFRGATPEDAELPARIILRGGKIAGSVELHGAELRGDTKNSNYAWALDLAQCEIGNAVSCLEKSHEDDGGSQGEATARFMGGISFNRSYIHNTLWLRGVHIHQFPEHEALNFEGAEILGSVVVDQAHLYWNGYPLIRLLHTEVRRDLHLHFTTWTTSEQSLVDYIRYLIFARDLSAGGSINVFPTRGSVIGYLPAVDFSGARIMGDATFLGDGIYSLVLRNAVIKSDLNIGHSPLGSGPDNKFLVAKGRFQFRTPQKGFDPEHYDAGGIDFLNAHIGGRLSARNISLLDNYADLDRFEPCDHYSCELRCYPGWRLHQVALRRELDRADNGVLNFRFLSRDNAGNKNRRILDGRSEVFHALNQEKNLRLNSTEAAFEYLQLFCENLLGGKLWESWAPFHIRPVITNSDPEELLNSFERLPKNQKQPDLSSGQDLASDFPDYFNVEERPELLQFRMTPAKDGYEARGLVLYQGIYFLSLFRVGRDGSVLMVEDAPATIDDQNPISNKNFAPIVAGAFHPSAPIREFLFSERITDHNLTKSIRNFVDKIKKEEFNTLKSGAYGFRLRTNPFRIDLRSADAAILDDLDGAAWDENFHDDDDPKKRKNLRIELENFTYQAIFQDIDNIKRRSPSRIVETQSDGENGDGKSLDRGPQSLTQSGRPDSDERPSDTYEELASKRIGWINRQLVDKHEGLFCFDYENYCAQPYRQLISIMERVGETEVAKRIAIGWTKTKHRVEEKQAPDPITGFGLRMGHLLLKHGFYYGYGWLRACALMVALILAGMGSAVWLESRGLLVSDDEIILGMNDGEAQRAASCKDVADFFVYSADLFVPLVDFQQKHRCRIPPVSYELRADYQAAESIPAKVSLLEKDPRFYEFWKGLYVLLGWVWTALTGLTVTGVLRRAGLRE